MTITIRDKHTGLKEDYEELYELYTDSVNICLTIDSKDGWKKRYFFNKKDYEIAYIG